MITPTVGRVVHYYPSDADNMMTHNGTGPMAAIVTHVWNDRLVNLSVFDHNGRQWPVQQVVLLQGDNPVTVDQRHCEWMPYQQQVAVAKPDTAAVESELLTMVNAMAARMDALDMATLLLDEKVAHYQATVGAATLDLTPVDEPNIPAEIQPFREE